jgi:hypothetical protein
MSQCIILSSEIKTSILHNHRLFQVPLMASAVTVNYPVAIPIVEIQVKLNVSRESIPLIPYLIQILSGPNISLSSIVAIVGDILWGETVAPATTLKMNYRFICSISITLGIVDTCRGAV